MQKKARVNEIVNRIVHHSLHNLAILELNSDPDAVHGRRAVIEFQLVVARISLEGLYEEDRFGVRYRNIFDNPCVKPLYTKYLGGSEGSIAQQNFQILPYACFKISLDQPVLLSNDDLLRMRYLRLLAVLRYISPGGVSLYCFIL